MNPQNTNRQYQNTDFNDVAIAHGQSAVAQSILAQIRNLAPANDANTSPAPPTNGARKQSDLLKRDADWTIEKLTARFAYVISDGKVSNTIFDTLTNLEYTTEKKFRRFIGNDSLVDEFYKNTDPVVLEADEIKKRLNECKKAKIIKASEDDDTNIFTRYWKILGTKEVWDAHKTKRISLEALKSDIHRAYDVWLESENRQDVYPENIVFDPTGRLIGENSDENYINTFTGMPLETLPMTNKEAYHASVDILSLVLHLCENQVATANWVIRWLAIQLQKPGTKMDTAIIFHHEENGVGKSLFWGRIVGQLFGDYHTTIGQKELNSDYNGWASSKLFGLAEEVMSGKEKYQNQGMIKHLITGDKIYINEKYQSAYTENNYINMVFLSNDLIPMYLDKKDRRHVVISPSQKIPSAMRDNISQALNDPAKMMIRAFYTYLMTLDIGDFSAHSQAIMTSAKARLINLSMKSYEKFYFEWSYFDQEEQKYGLLNYPYCSCKSEDLYLAYKQWCHKTNERAVNMTTFSQYIKTKEAFKRARVNINSSPVSVFIIGQNLTGKDQRVWLQGETSEFAKTLGESYL